MLKKLTLMKPSQLLSMNLKEYFMEVKYDGVRCKIIVEDDNVELYTRSGKRINSPDYENYFKEVLPKGIYDSEIIYGEYESEKGKIDTASIISGLVNSAIKGGSLLFSNKVTFHLFDKIDRPKIALEQRRRELNNIVNEITKEFDFKFIRAAEDIVIISNKSENEDSLISNTALAPAQVKGSMSFVSLIDNGFEGVVLKKKDSFYNDKRDKDWLKFKRKDTCDAICIGFEPGKGKYENKIGALKCKLGDRLFSVGSGMDDKDREKNPLYYLNQVIEVEYYKLTDTSIAQPRFIRVRADK